MPFPALNAAFDFRGVCPHHASACLWCHDLTNRASLGVLPGTLSLACWQVYCVGSMQGDQSRSSP